MRTARLFDHRDQNGGWAVAPDRLRISDPEERARLAQFLRGGGVAVRINGFDDDVIDPTREPGPPLSIHTDGTWTWSTQITYYLVTYGIAPEPDLCAHIRECDHRAAVPGPATLMRAE